MKYANKKIIQLLRKYLTILSCSVGALNLCVFSILAQAQEYDYRDLPILNPNSDFNGVDATSGIYSTVSPLAFSVPAAGSLSSFNMSFNGRKDTFSLNVYLDDKTYTPDSSFSNERHIRVHVGGKDKLFTCINYGECTQDVRKEGVRLTRVNETDYVFTDKSGAKYSFYPIFKNSLPDCAVTGGDAVGCNAAEYQGFAYVREILYSNGEKLTYQPFSTVETIGGETFSVDTIQSNLGYSLAFKNSAPANYQNYSKPGMNWLQNIRNLGNKVGVSTTKVEIYRGATKINSLTTVRNKNTSTTPKTVSAVHKDDIGRTYEVNFKGGSVQRCNLDSYAVGYGGTVIPTLNIDNTVTLPAHVKSPNGVNTYIEYHMDDAQKWIFSEAAGLIGTSVPVKKITRGPHVWQYDNKENEKTITDPYGEQRKVQFSWVHDGYDYGYVAECPMGYIETQINTYKDELERLTSYDYLGNLLDSAYLPESNGYSYTYDGRGNIIKITQHPKSAQGFPDRVIFQAGYPSSCSNSKFCNKPEWVKDAKGNTTDYTYSSVHGGVETITKPAQENGIRPVITYSYKSHNTEVGGTIWRQSKISMCTEDTDCTGTNKEKIVETEYWNNTFLPKTVTVSAGDNSISAADSFDYDVAGRLTKTTDALGHSTHYFYDIVGRKIGEIGEDPDGSGPLLRIGKRIAYNSGDQPTLVESGITVGTTNSDLNELSPKSYVQIGYDELGRKKIETVVSDAAMGSSEIISKTQYSYDAWNRPVCTAVRMNFSSVPSDACQLGAEGPFGYDRITKNEYDDAGQLEKIYKAYGTPLQQVYSEFEYSDNGKKTIVIDANSNKSKLEYDGYDRQTHWYFPSKTKGSTTYSSTDFEQYGYDLNDNRTSYRKRDGSVLTYGYDNLNRMTWKTAPSLSGLSTSHTQDTYYGYDNRGLALYSRYGSDSGQGVTQTYNALGHMTSSTINIDGVSRKLSYNSNSKGLRNYITHPDGKTFSYFYDELDRLTGISHSSAGTLASYGYDEKGHLFYMDGGISTDYEYDGVGRLKKLTHDLSYSSSDNTYEYQYNPASQIANIYASNIKFAPLSTQQNKNYQVDGLNQYSEVSGFSYGYDDNGNLTSDGQTTYTYDQENRLVKATNNDGTLKAELWYDPLGRLYKVQGASETTQFLYDGDELVAEFNGASTTVKERYVHGISEDDPVAWFQGSSVTSSNRHHLRSNHQGSIIAVTNSFGHGYSFLPRYDNWGKPESTHPVRFGYTGQVWTEDLGLWHYKARMYSPVLGRFMQTDPVGYEDQMNLYAYVYNDPMNNTDPSGKCPMCLGIIVGAGLEIARQGITGELSLSAASLGKISIAGAAGATGAGIGRGIAALTTSVVARAAGNATAGAVIGAAATAGNNLIDGKDLTDGLGKGAAFGFAGGALGSAVGDAADAASAAAKSGAFNKLPTSTKNLLQHIDETTSSAQGSGSAKGAGVGDALGNFVSNSTGAAEAAATSNCTQSGTTSC